MSATLKTAARSTTRKRAPPRQRSHLSHDLEANEGRSGLGVQWWRLLVSRSSTWRVGLAGAERVHPKAASISGRGPPRRPAAGGEVRSLKTGRQGLQVPTVNIVALVRVVATTGNPRRLVIRLNERHHAVVRRTVQPLHRLQKLSSGGQQGELLSLGKRLYGGPFSSRSQRQLAVDANS
ncbi:hypothetical protein TYRP_012206 [Tyrophagus putrescentiae]|nr:hypothetical protein TYRP_012206 [Tyrophagus putrescentiae]